MTGKSLRLLVIEDVEDHALLIVREIIKGGYSPIFRRVETLDQLKVALAEESWDAIISDFRLPGFNAVDALRHVQSHGDDVPFILVSGVIGEEMAAEIMKAGAHGYIMKGNYARLVPTLERELREAAVRRERRETAETLTRRREHLEVLVHEKMVEAERTRECLETESRARKLAEEELVYLKAQLADCSSRFVRINREMKALRDNFQRCWWSKAQR